jgi:hypothetical protein
MDEKEDYLAYVNNDVVKLIGYKIQLVIANDTEGIQLWDTLDRKMYKNYKLNKGRIAALLHEVPLYYVLSLLGYAHYRHKLIPK